MLFSVFNWDTLSYDYYQSAEGPAPGRRAKPRRRYRGGESVRPEDVLPILPIDAIRVGTGPDARGRVAVTPAVAAASAAQGPVEASGLTGFGVSVGTVASTSFQSLLATGFVLAALYYGFKLIEGSDRERSRKR